MLGENSHFLPHLCFRSGKLISVMQVFLKIKKSGLSQVTTLSNVDMKRCQSTLKNSAKNILALSEVLTDSKFVLATSNSDSEFDVYMDFVTIVYRSYVDLLKLRWPHQHLASHFLFQSWVTKQLHR